MKPSKSGHAGGTAPWLRRRQTRSARPAGTAAEPMARASSPKTPTPGVRRNRIPAADTHDISSRVTTLTRVARMPGLIATGSSAISRPGKTPMSTALARPGA